MAIKDKKTNMALGKDEIKAVEELEILYGRARNGLGLTTKAKAIFWAGVASMKKQKDHIYMFLFSPLIPVIDS